jgi:hypothetical protein
MENFPDAAAVIDDRHNSTELETEQGEKGKKEAWASRLCGFSVEQVQPASRRSGLRDGHKRLLNN